MLFTEALRRQLASRDISYRVARSVSYSKEAPAQEVAHEDILTMGVLDANLAISACYEEHFVSFFTLTHDHVLWEKDLHLELRDDELDQVLVVTENLVFSNRSLKDVAYHFKSVRKC